MAEIDPVVLEIVARVSRYQTDLKQATRTVDEQLGRQERKVKQLENQFKQSSGAISASLKSLATALAAGFTGQQLVGLIDQFTRFENSLRVAGLEGENLAAVQERLFQTGAKYGVSINALADLYGKAEQAGRDLGASQSELLALTDAVAQSLLVSGVSTEQASGAILGLSQALSSGTVRAEEFNQINEGGLRVLLEAAAAGDRYNGSVSRLRQAVIDGKVSSEEFYRSILANTDLIESRAANANLTLSGALTALNDSLARYVGSAASANGVTGALADGIKTLAENLDTIIPAIATIAGLFGIRFVAGLAASAVQAAGLRVVALGLAAQLNGTAAAATLAGRSLLAAFGGPVGIAIGAITIGLALAAAATTDAERAAAAYAKGQEVAAQTTDKAREAAERLASAHGQTRVEALAAARAEAELTKQKIASAKASLQQAQAELARLKVANQRDLRSASMSTSGAGGGTDRLAIVANRDGQRLTAAENRVQQARGQLDGLTKSLGDLQSVINSATAPGVAPVSTASRGGGSASSTRSGPDPASIEARYRDELDSIRIRINQAEGERALTAQERAEFEGRQLEIAEDMALRQIEADQDYNDAQKAELKLRLQALGDAERDNIAFRERAQLEREQLDILEEQGRARLDGLRLDFDLATTDKDRRRIALQILDAEESVLREKLQAQINSKTLNDIDVERARIALAALDAQSADQRKLLDLQYASPLKRYANDAKDVDTRVEEAAVRRIEDLNDSIANAMTRALGVKDPFLSELIKIFLDKNVFGPLAEALSSQQGGGGGFFSSLFQIGASLFGRASGGPVTAGQMYRVNEGASPGRVEAFVPNTSGKIIPLGRMNALQAGGSQGGIATVRLQLSGDLDARIEGVSAGVAVEVVRQSAGQIIDAAANETLSRANRPRL